MNKVIIYTKTFCPFCHDAKALLQEKGASFTEYDLLSVPEKRAEMIEKAGGRSTVPQIFIGERHVGGCDDLYALERAGRLDPLLQGAA